MTDQTPPANSNETGPEQSPAPPTTQAPSFPPSQAPQFPADQQQQPAPQQYPVQQPAPQQYPATTQYPAAPGYPQQPQQPQAPQQYPYQQAGYPGAVAPGAVAPKPTNTLAIVSLILGIVFAPAGIVTGHMALSKIKRTGEGGRGLALAGTIIGYISTGLAVLSLIFVLIATFIIGTAAVTAASSGLSQLEQLDSLEIPDPSTQAPDELSSGELLDTPEKILAAWEPCDLAMELNNPGDAFYDDAEWYSAQEALAQLMDPSAESDAIRAYVDHMMNGTGFDFELTSAHVDATAAAQTKFCSQ